MVWAVSAAGGGILAVKAACGAVGALAGAAGVALARNLGGAAAGWFFLPVTLMGPFLCWSMVPYQESGLLAVSLGALALATSPNPSRRLLLCADLLAGAAALSRYEGWVFVALYVAWRRDVRAGVALWGAAIWLGVKALGIESHAPSPVSYADWEGLVERFSWSSYAELLAEFAGQIYWRDTGILIPLGAVGAVRCSRARTPTTGLLLLWLASQLAIVSAWIAALEHPLFRMQIVPGFLLGIFSACWLADLWRGLAERPRGTWGRAALALGAVATSALWVYVGHNETSRHMKRYLAERDLRDQMAGCAGCVWVIAPRVEMGPRDRHDACEILQGLSPYLHEREFWCAAWPAESEPPADAWRATWVPTPGYDHRGHFTITPPEDGL